MAEAIRMAFMLGQIIEGNASLPEHPRLLQPAPDKQGAAHGSIGFQQHGGLLSCLGDGKELFREFQ